MFYMILFGADVIHSSTLQEVRSERLVGAQHRCHLIMV